MKTWECKIGEAWPVMLIDEADVAMREAVTAAYTRVAGEAPTFVFSGWGGELTEPERAIVENRQPSEAHYRQWLRREAADDLYNALKAFDERGYTQAVGDSIRRALAKAEGSKVPATDDAKGNT